MLLLSLPAIVVRLQQHERQKGGGQWGSHGRRKQPTAMLVALPFFLDSGGGEAGCRSTLVVSPIIVSCNGGLVAAIVSPRCHCTVVKMRMVEGGRATGIAQAIKDDSSCAPSFFVRRGREMGHGRASTVASIVVSWVRGHIVILSFLNCKVIILCSFFLLDKGVGEPDAEVHQRLHPLSSLTTEGTLLSLSLFVIFIRLQRCGRQKGEGDGDQAGGGSNQGQCCLCSLLLLNSRDEEAGHGSTLAVSTIVVSCNGGHVAVIVSPRHCHTVATTWTLEGGKVTGIVQEAIKDNSSCTPSFFCTAGAGKPDVDVHQRLHPLSSPGSGGTLLLLSFPICNVAVLCSFFLLDRGGGGEA